MYNKNSYIVSYRNDQEEICYKLLSNGLFSPKVIPPEKKLQIISQNFDSYAPFEFSYG
jgi:hypothetical protein